MIRIDHDDYDYCNVPIYSSSIKCTSKILYYLYTTLLTPNGPFFGSRIDKNEFKIKDILRDNDEIQECKVV